jgi:NADH dehydrogenase FAD-containing subunit
MIASNLKPLCIGIYEKYNELKNVNEKKKVYLLGQGWLAKGFLDHIDKKKYYIINISRNIFINTPLLLQSIKNEGQLQKYNLDKKVNEYHNVSITDIDLKKGMIKTNFFNFMFTDKDYIVCGLGSDVDQGIYWSSIIKNINNYNKKINIIGAGPTGTELAFYMKDKGYNVKIFDCLPIDKLYSYLSEEAKYKILSLQHRNNIWLMSNTLYNKDLHEGDVIFAIGFKSNLLTSNWKITDKLLLENYNNIFAGGDCINQNYPKNAQVAYQQGAFIAKKLNGELNENEIFVYKNNGIALYCGNNNHLINKNKETIILPSYLVNLYYKIFY